MAGIKISELTELTGANASDSDVFVIVDVDADETKKITYQNLLASNLVFAKTAERVKQDATIEQGLRVAGSNEKMHVLMSPIGSTTSQHTSEHVSGITGFDSVGYSYLRMYWMADSATLYSRNGIRTNGGTGQLQGIADQALVADSANFNLTSVNDVVDNFTGLVTGQVLKWNGTAWENQNDLSGDAGSGVIAKQLNTVSETTDADFLIPFVGAVGADSVGVDAGLQYNPSTDTLTVANITGTVSQASSATLATTSTDAQNVIADSVAPTGTYYVLLRNERDPGADSVNMTANFSWEASTNTLSATNFNGNGSSLSNVAALSATNATNVAINQESTDANFYMHFGSALSGNHGVDVDGDLTVNPGQHTMRYSDNNARFTLGADSDFSIDAGGTRYSFNVSNNGASAYTFGDTAQVFFPTDSDNPVLYLRRGDTYRFDVNASGHPFEIRQSDGGSAYNTGVTNNGVEVGSVLFKVSMSTPSTLYYQCTVHSGMGNTINIV